MVLAGPLALWHARLYGPLAYKIRYVLRSFPSLRTALTIVTIVTIATMASDTEADFSIKLSQFLASKNTNLEDRLALKAFLDARPTYSKPTSYVSDIEQRLELLREIQQECEKARYRLEFTAALWSVLMVAPLEQLRYLRDSPFRSLASTLDGVISNISMLLKVCMLHCQFILLMLTVSSPFKRPITGGIIIRAFIK